MSCYVDGEALTRYHRFNGVRVDWIALCKYLEDLDAGNNAYVDEDVNLIYLQNKGPEDKAGSLLKVLADYTNFATQVLDANASRLAVVGYGYNQPYVQSVVPLMGFDIGQDMAEHIVVCSDNPAFLTIMHALYVSPDPPKITYAFFGRQLGGITKRWLKDHPAVNFVDLDPNAKALIKPDPRHLVTKTMTVNV